MENKNKKISNSLKKHYRMKRGGKKLKAIKIKLIWLLIFTALIGFYTEQGVTKFTEASAPYERQNASFPESKDKDTATMTVKDRIILEAQKANFQWTDYLLKLANCESRLNEFAENTQGNKPPSKDRGVFQINDYWQSQVPDSVAYNVEEATRWTMDRINNGYQHLWVCDRLIKANPNKYAVK